MDDNDFWEEDHDTQPYADPQIRRDYEAALGRLILAHNEVDWRLGKALQRVVVRIAPDGRLNAYARGTFEQRLSNLELFQKTSPASGPVQIDVSALRRLNTIRNNVAHGHFDQNPFDGTYTLIGQARGKEHKPGHYSIAELDTATDALARIASTLNAHEVFGDFPHLTYLPPGAQPA